MTGVDLVHRRLRGDFLVVACANVGVGDLADHFLFDHLAMQGALLQEGCATLEIGILVEPVGDGLRGKNLDLDGRGKGGGAALFRRKLRELLRQFTFGERQIRFSDRLAVNRGNDCVRIDRSSSRSCGGIGRLGRLGRLSFLGGQRRKRQSRQADGQT